MLASSLLLVALISTDVSLIVSDPSGARVPGARVEVDPGTEKTLTLFTGGSGEAVLSGFDDGEHRLRVSLAGFETWEKSVRIRPRQKPIEVRLRLGRIAEDIAVSPDERGSAAVGYKTTLTEADLANLPDDPDQLEAALRAIAGPQASMRVNGFASGRLPPKSQIRQVRFVMNPYAAEFHEAQPMMIDVQAKPGLGEWSRTARLGLRDDTFNARPPLAPSRVPDSYRRFGFDLAGPIVRNKTSLSLSAEGRLTDTARTVRAATLRGRVSELADSSTDRVDLSARLEHGWGKTHTLRAEFESLSRNEAGLGIGGFDLKERGYSQDLRDNTARFTDNGVIFGRVASEVRLSGEFTSSTLTPNSTSPSVRVLGAFGAGGAGVTGEKRTRDLEISSNFDLSVRKSHALRFGFHLRDLSVTSTEQQNTTGAFTFSDLASYQAGRPSLFTQRTGNPQVDYAMRHLGLYVQDEAKVSKKLTVAAGLRMEGQSQIDGFVSLGPRLSATYAPNSRTTLRAGAGRFFNWYEADTYEQTRRLDGRRETETILENPSWPDPFVMSPSDSTSRSTRITTSDILSLPRLWRSSLGVERNLVGRLRLTLDYTYQRGTHELRSRNRSAAGSSLSVREIDSDARSTRHTIDTRLNLMPQPNTRAGFFVGYLRQSARNEADGPLSLPANESDLAAEWGRASNDARHRVFGLLNLNPNRQISFGAMLFASSGLPFNITTGRDDNGDAVFNDRPSGVRRNAGVGPTRINLDLRLGWTRNFGGTRAPRPGEGIRVVRIGGGDGVPDMSNSGDPQRYRVSVFVQAFNALNRTNPVAVGTILGSPLFGAPVVADPGRRLELGATFAF